MESYETQIQRSIDYIEEDVMEKQTLRNLARVAGFSESHFHRVFQALVGDTVMEYVRKRRLARAAYQLSHTDEKVIDIAFEHGFQSHETFTRAFKKLFQMTPSEYRKQEIETPMYYRVNVKQRKLNPYLGGIQMEYRIVNKPEFLVAGYELKTTSKEGKNHQDIPVFWQEYLQKNLGTTIPNRKDTSQWVELGLCTDFNLETGDFTYIIGMEVTDLKMYQMKLQSVLSRQQHMQYLQRRKFLMKKWYRLSTKLGMQYSQNGFRIQAMNIAALQSLNYTMSVATKIRVSCTSRALDTGEEKIIG